MRGKKRGGPRMFRAGSRRGWGVRVERRRRGLGRGAGRGGAGRVERRSAIFVERLAFLQLNDGVVMRKKSAMIVEYSVMIVESMTVVLVMRRLRIGVVKIMLVML